MESNLLVTYAYHKNRSEILREGTEFVVNFYVGETLKSSSRYKFFDEAITVAEGFVEKAPGLLVE
jgi:hypothetical protein